MKNRHRHGLLTKLMMPTKFLVTNQQLSSDITSAGYGFMTASSLQNVGETQLLERNYCGYGAILATELDVTMCGQTLRNNLSGLGNFRLTRPALCGLTLYIEYRGRNSDYCKRGRKNKITLRMKLQLRIFSAQLKPIRHLNPGDRQIQHHNLK